MKRIDFMVLSAPRSASTWVANWLTGDGVYCHHDALAHFKPKDLDMALCVPGKVVGVSCTGLALFPDFVNSHPARKLLLIREEHEIEASLARIGIEQPHDWRWRDSLSKIKGMAVPWNHVLDPKWAEGIYEYLTGGRNFDFERHSILMDMYVAPRLPSIHLNRGHISELHAQADL